MGGFVRFSVRESSGLITNMLHHTDNLQAKIMSGDFLEEGNAFKKMLADWRSGKERFKKEPPENFDYYDKIIYKGDESLTPYDYGIVFIDFKDKNIFSLQSYCSLDRFTGISVFDHVNSIIWRHGKEMANQILENERKSEASFIAELLKNKRIKNAVLEDYPCGNGHLGFNPVPNNIIDLFDASQYFRSNLEETDYLRLDLDLGEFTLHDIDETQSGINELLIGLKNSGIVPLSSELDSWNCFFEY